MYNEYRYDPSDMDDELFLSDVPVEIIQSSIDTQFQDPLEYRKKDYVQSFLTKYEFSKDNMLEDDLLLVEEYRDSFLIFMEKTFEKYLGVGLANLENLPEDEQNELVHLTYRFFIKNIKKNFVTIIYNFIDDRRDSITEMYEKKKDVTSLNFKLEINDDYDVLVLSNLNLIIKDILNALRENCNDVDEFFDLCTGDEVVLELEYVKEAYDKYELTGNFISKYVDMISEDFITEIQSKVRNKILKKYPKRTVAKELQTEEEIDDIEETDNIEE